MNTTISEVSKITHIPETTIRTWIKKDFLHATKQGNARLVDPEHVIYVQEKLQGKHQGAFEVLKSNPVYFFDNYVNNAGYRCTPGNTMQLTFQGSC